MHSYSPIALLALTLAATHPLGAAPAPQQDFQWRGRLAAGQTLEVRGVNGEIRAEHAAGDEAQVVATKRARRSDPAEVEVEVLRHDAGVTICAVYPTPRSRRPNECRPGGGRNSVRDNDVKVDFTVRIPAGVRFVGATVNGDVEATGLRSDAEVATVNGGIRLSTTGHGEAHTVNGSITAALGAAAWAGSLAFETVNGSITLDLPADLHTDVRAQTVNGAITSDFPIAVSGRIGPRRLNGTIGSGGRALHLKTVNGAIRLRSGA